MTDSPSGNDRPPTLPTDLPEKSGVTGEYVSAAERQAAAASDSQRATITDLERRVRKLEDALFRQSIELQNLRQKSFAAWLEAKFRPRLFQFEQYSPRAIVIPPRYHSESPPPIAPAIAIVTPSYNQGQFLEATIKSVIDQKYPRLAYHVQDANSTDRTRGLLEKHSGAIGFSCENDNGQADAIQRGFAKVEGDIMAYLNSDDCLLPGSLTYVAKYFVNHPEVDVIYGHRILIDSSDREIGRILLPAHDYKVLKWFDPVPQETMFWRRRVWTALGGLDTSFKYAMDWDFILRAQRAGFRFARVPRFLGCFRVHEAQKTTSLRDVGDRESSRLRKEHLGFEPSPKQIDRAIKPYIRRHVIIHRLYQLSSATHRWLV